MESGAMNQKIEPKLAKNRSVASLFWIFRLGRTPEPLPVGKENFLLNRYFMFI